MSTLFAATAARIFGNVVGNGLRSGNKVLRKSLAGPQILSWYPPAIELLGDTQFKDPQRARADLATMRRKKKGKTVKKGEGKRASSGKKK
ncbi:mitochondrial ribosomal protein S33 (mS33) [Andalucia godoyi]|uniref:Small ribosomal subunit protein mS33 n=1 Tax=Andalucia godoyi TaxID=505711 RepID=A0A8K0F226_ANDGO|nr:mitochondrial ribosomal protein S33 (mS33) [Andalucia godoyi]|eukprot:ANDGO_02870.mRNA.1 mitochondrial ribosomal protein S33 (mS33)